MDDYSILVNMLLRTDEVFNAGILDESGETYYIEIKPHDSTVKRFKDKKEAPIITFLFDVNRNLTSVTPTWDDPEVETKWE